MHRTRPLNPDGPGGQASATSSEAACGSIAGCGGGDLGQGGGDDTGGGGAGELGVGVHDQAVGPHDLGEILDVVWQDEAASLGGAHTRAARAMPMAPRVDTPMRVSSAVRVASTRAPM